MSLKYIISVIFIIISSFVFGQNKIDSLYKELSKAENDTTKVDLFIKISRIHYKKDDYINYLNTTASIKKIIENESFDNKINSYFNLLKFYKEVNLYDSLIVVYDRIANEYLQNNDTINFIINKNNEAYHRSVIGMQKKALEILYDNLRFADKKNDSSLLYETYFYLGFGIRKSNYKKSKQYFDNSLKYNSDTLNSFYSACLNEIGNNFTIQGKPEEAIPYIRRALKIRRITNDESISYSYNDIAYAYAKLGKYYNAILYMHKCIDYEIEKDVDWELAMSYSALGYYYMKARKMANAEKYLNISLEYAKKINVYPVYNDIYSNLYKLYKTKEDFKTALYYYELSENYEDTISLNNTEKQIAELEKKYINGKQASKLIIMESEKEAVDAIIIRQRIIGVVVILLIIILIFFLNSEIKSRRKSREINKALSKQNKAIKQQSLKIEDAAKKIKLANKRIADRNIYIIDNIKYARKIQKAMLPSKKDIRKIIPQSFIIYKPKNIVSGDFYLIKEINDKIIIVVSDCTGHGVSGAFMSVLGMSLINDIVLKDKIIEPAGILDSLRIGVINSLNQKKEYNEATDGMDLGLCIYDKKRNQIKYAGAQMSLYIATKEGVIRIKPDIMPVGVGFRDDRKFSQQTINLTGEETIYMFSDGYPDQFGGKNAKKFMLGNVIKMLENIHDKPMNIQKNYLEASLKQWQGTHKQIDDILFGGFRF